MTLGAQLVVMTQHSLFVRKLQWNRAICSNCFRRLFEPSEINFIVQNDGYPKPVRKSLDDVLLPHRDFLPGIESVPYPAPGVGMTRSCKCGMLRHSTTTRPVDTSTLITYGQRVVERLAEQDYQLDEDSFFDKIRELKSDPSEQHQDDTIIERAIESAVQKPAHEDTDGPSRLRQSRPA
jgi:hypothetical protein